VVDAFASPASRIATAAATTLTTTPHIIVASNIFTKSHVADAVFITGSIALLVKKRISRCNQGGFGATK
jgi:hypothetical protein